MLAAAIPRQSHAYTMSRLAFNTAPRTLSCPVHQLIPSCPLNSDTEHSTDDVRFTTMPVQTYSRSQTVFNTHLLTSPHLIGNSKRFYSTDAPVKSKKHETTRIPSFDDYKKPARDSTNGRGLGYLMVGSTGFIGAVGAKNLVSDLITQLSPAADIVALAKAEVALSAIPEGKNVIIKWRGKPVFIRHRTAGEIDEANAVPMSELKDPQSDADRVKKPEWLVMLGVCTHLGCVPIGESGDYDGWYCPCHGSHYDISGRIRKGPAPLNLEVPPYDFTEDGSHVIIG